MSREVSVIVPAYNEAGAIAATLASVLAQRPRPAEIVVADGGSTDGTADAARAMSGDVPVRVVPNHERRVGAGRNRAIAAARHDVIAAIDCGNTARPGWLAALLATLDEHGGRRLVAGRIVPRPCGPFEHAVAGVVYGDMLAPGRGSAAGWSSSCMALHRDAWRAAGGYPEWLEAGEDKLFVRKATAVGYPPARCEAAVVEHHVRGSAPALARQMLRYGRGSGLSGQTPPHVAGVGLRYAVGAALLLTAAATGGTVAAGALAVAVAGGAWHVWRQGFRRFLDAGVGATPARLALVPVVLLARDAGALAGHAAGNLERLTRAEPRRLAREYLA